MLQKLVVAEKELWWGIQRREVGQAPFQARTFDFESLDQIQGPGFILEQHESYFGNSPAV